MKGFEKDTKEYDCIKNYSLFIFDKEFFLFRGIDELKRDVKS